MNLDLDDLKVKIENHVQAREVTAAIKLIKKRLKLNPANPQNIYATCDWYRRLGLYKEGLRLLKFDGTIPLRVTLDQDKGLRYLWIVRFLNLTGASQIALRLAKRLEPTNANHHRIVAGIYLSNFLPKLAVKHYDSFSKIDPNPDSHSSKIARIEFADALVSLGETEKALKLLDDLDCRGSHSEILTAIILQARGEIYALSGNASAAVEILERAKAKFSINDQTTDYAFLLKWLGFSYGQSGNHKIAKHHFKTAQEILGKEDYRPEMFLHAKLLEASLGYCDEVEMERLRRFPGITASFKLEIEKYLGPPIAMSTRPRQLLNQINVLTICSGTEEWTYGPSTHIGLPLEIKLLEILALAGPWGLGQSRVIGLLWPDEASAFMQCFSRVEQLMIRLQKCYNLTVSSKGKKLYLSESSLGRVRIDHQSSGLPKVLLDWREFTAAQVEYWLKISRASCRNILQKWISQGLITQRGSGPSCRYVILNSSGERSA